MSGGNVGVDARGGVGAVAPNAPPAAAMLSLLSTLARRERRVLLLQGERAVWTLWRGRRCSDERSGPIATVAADGDPWPAVDGTLVDVVADSPLDDIETVQLSASDGVGGGLRGRLRRLALRLRLQRAHPDARVRMAPAAAEPFVASLLRAELPEPWRRCLESLQEGELTVRSVRSAIRLHRTDLDGANADVLLVSGDTGVERHVLYRSGCAAFTRVIDVADADASARALDETLAHLASSPRLAASREDGAPRVLRVDSSEERRRLARAALAARDAGSPAVPAALLDKRHRHDELRRLLVMTTLTALIACATVLAAAIHGVNSARERARAAAAAEAIEAHVEALEASLAARHADPARAAASLAWLGGREATRAPEGSVVLRLLAEVLTAHPGVQVERLAWAAREPGGEIDEVSFTRAASLPPRRSDEIVTGEDVLLEIAGRVDVPVDTPAAVGERQRRFEAFADALEGRAGVDELLVRLSPAAAASDGAEAGRASPIDYELRLRYAGAR